jgi:demethylmenaquinone methyltransferase/2-methoxy-6-polyprenyl-1,4-benzoquinol methylase
MTQVVPPHRPLEHYYGDAAHREGYVREIFDETSPWYDWATQFMSFGSGDWYRREALRRAGLTPGMKVLDLAAGTGPVTRAIAEVTGSERAAFAIDPSIGMLTSGRIPGARVNAPAELLPLRSQSFDFISIGFALRHFADLQVVFDECHRVLRPGGRILILEITAPASRLGRAFLGAYMGGVVPLAVRIKTRSKRAAELFRYYWETTRDCVRPAVILDTLRAAGFEEPERHVETAVFSEYTAIARPR